MLTTENCLLREAASVSGECMNRVYDMLRVLPTDHLLRMWEAADPYTPHGALLRWQIGVVVERRIDGRWRD